MSTPSQVGEVTRGEVNHFSLSIALPADPEQLSLVFDVDLTAALPPTDFSYDDFNPDDFDTT